MESRLKILAECKLFKTLPPQALEMAAARCEEGEAEAGEALVVEGKPADGLYVVVEGNVDYIKRVDEKRGLVLLRWQPGDVVGLDAVMDGKEHYVSAVAATPVKYLRFSAEDFWAVCAADPLYEHRVLRQTLLIQSAGLRQTTLRLREFLAKIIK
ncbi:MAG TPA: cyclic nucleotide-binding domain-containing protein [bacterium]|nr:cyclic nucleotide-binding domain-containing protein [bacterium]